MFLGVGSSCFPETYSITWFFYHQKYLLWSSFSSCIYSGWTFFMYPHHNVLTWCVFVCTSCWRELRLEQQEVKLSPRSIWLQPRTWTPSGLLGQASFSFYCSVNSTSLTDIMGHYSDITLLPPWPLIQGTTTPCIKKINLWANTLKEPCWIHWGHWNTFSLLIAVYQSHTGAKYHTRIAPVLIMNIKVTFSNHL